MDNAPTCVICGGLGFIFEQVNANHRKQLDCPACAGSGRHDVCLARTLSGEAKEPFPSLSVEARTAELLSRRGLRQQQTSD